MDMILQTMMHQSIRWKWTQQNTDHRYISDSMVFIDKISLTMFNWRQHIGTIYNSHRVILMWRRKVCMIIFDLSLLFLWHLIRIKRIEFFEQWPVFGCWYERWRCSWYYFIVLLQNVITYIVYDLTTESPRLMRIGRTKPQSSVQGLTWSNDDMQILAYDALGVKYHKYQLGLGVVMVIGCILFQL